VTAEALRWLARAHGVAAWLAVAGLIVAAALSLRRRGAGGRADLVANADATALVTASFAAGLALDLPYRALLRQRVFIESPALGWLFERKAHLAFGALALAWSALALRAAAAARALSRPPAPWARDLERGARSALFGSAVLALIAAACSTIVARRYPF
jgi:hypothetical protein